MDIISFSFFPIFFHMHAHIPCNLPHSPKTDCKNLVVKTINLSFRLGEQSLNLKLTFRTQVHHRHKNNVYVLWTLASFSVQQSTVDLKLNKDSIKLWKVASFGIDVKLQNLVETCSERKQNVSIYYWTITLQFHQSLCLPFMNSEALPIISFSSAILHNNTHFQLKNIPSF